MSDLSDDDKKLFRDAMRGVTKLGEAGKESVLPQQKPRAKDAILSRNDLDPNDHEAEIELSYEHMAQQVPHHHFSHGGLQHKQMKRLQQGKIPFEAAIDLHHMTLKEAEQAVRAFVRDSRAHGMKCIKIIHGRGLHTRPGRITLLHMVRYLLTEIEGVLAYSATPQALGGNGAVLVLLKRERDE